MTTCAHRFLDLADGLPCSRPEHPDHPHDHVYLGTSVADQHDVSEQRAEAEHG